MKKLQFKYILFILLILFFCNSGTMSFFVFADNQDKIDSLEKIVPISSGSKKANILNRLAKENLTISPRKSIEYAQKALELSEKFDNKEEQATAFNNMGKGHYYTGNYDEALKYYRSYYDIVLQLGKQKEVAKALNNIGIIYRLWAN